MPRKPLDVWGELDPAADTQVAWLRAPSRRRVVVLMGAFDPPTNAHLSICCAAARLQEASGVLCLTKTLLARPPDELLPIAARIDLLLQLANEHDLGALVANRGTYIDVAGALHAAGADASFVIGSDKLAQLEDASFYPDGSDGVTRTFADVRFVVVPRPDRTRDRPGLEWLKPSEVFADPAEMTLSATEVRERLRRGEQVGHLVPGPVALALAGYTSAR